MSILSNDDWIASTKQILEFYKSAPRTSVAAGFFSLFDLAGQPGPGALAIGNTANGVVPIDTDAGYWPINAFAGGAKGYLSRVAYASSVITRLGVYDRVFAAGAYGFASGTTNLASQPSFAARVPGGTDFKGLEIWIEFTTALATGSAFNVTVTYTDQDGNTGATTGAFAVGAAGNGTLGRMYQLPLAAGDTGVQRIESVVITHTGMTAGAINVMVLRPLAPSLRVPIINGGDLFDMFKTGMPEVFADSAIFLISNPDSTSTGINEVTLEIASG
jgi:hypothetical protein